MTEAARIEVALYTDGACSGNPGVGAWAAILAAAGREKELVGVDPYTTNNRMELRAVIEGLKALKRPCRVHVYSDSAYVVNAFKQNWLDGWQRKGWRNSAGQSVSNKELWQELLALAEAHEIVWHKVKGHADNDYNNRCDALAVAAVKRYKQDRDI